MRELFQHISDPLSRGKGVVLVTVIETAGVTPRKPGARMLAGSKGLLAGTIGGGSVEGRCIAIAGELLRAPCLATSSRSRRTDSSRPTAYCLRPD